MRGWAIATGPYLPRSRFPLIRGGGYSTQARVVKKSAYVNDLQHTCPEVGCEMLPKAYCDDARWSEHRRMSNRERVLLALQNRCSVDVDVEIFSPLDLIAFADQAVTSGARVTFRNAFKKDPQTLRDLASRGANGDIAFVF